MKKLNILFFTLVLGVFMIFIFSCKKNENNPSQNPSTVYRMVSETLFDTTGSVLTLKSYTFSNDKLSHHEITDGTFNVIADYSYGTGVVNCILKTYRDTELYYENTIEYIFNDNKLSEIRTWYIDENNDSTLQEKIEFEYNGDKPSEYIEYSYSSLEQIFKPYSKGEYKFEGENLTRFSYYRIEKSEWVVWHTNELFYDEDSKLEEEWIYLTEGESSSYGLYYKLTYKYEDDLLSETKAFANYVESWKQQYVVNHIYDTNGNQIRSEFRHPGYSSMMYYYEYDYEIGESNMDELYFGWYPFTNNILEYPTPNNFNSLSKGMNMMLLGKKY